MVKKYKKISKKILGFLLIIFTAFAFSGCGGGDDNSENDNQNSDKKSSSFF